MAKPELNLPDSDRHGLYKTLFNRRDVRGQFLPDPIPDDVLSRVLYAAHHAPSVGFMQPWNFMLINDQQVKKQIHQDFTQAHQEAEKMFDSEKQSTYKNLKLEGILESPLNICITCDRERTGKTVIGRTHMPEMDLYSSVCAVQNLWLAARAEGLGIGWVSILHNEKLKAVLKLPDNMVPVAYLCVGYVSHFKDKPELEAAKWLPRTPLQDLIHYNTWESPQPEEDDLLTQIAKDENFPQTFIK